MGSNSSGKLGLGDMSISEVREPNLVPQAVNIISSACGDNHTLAVSGNGDVWAFGEGLCCGSGNLSPQPTPIKIAHHDKFMRASAGTEHSLILDTFGRVYGFGSNRLG
jgi:alpha-tubulin suppressor-like RCC1 family protein